MNLIPLNKIDTLTVASSPVIHSRAIELQCPKFLSNLVNGFLQVFFLLNLDEIYPLIRSIQTFMARNLHATTTESNPSHFLCILFARKKFHPAVFPGNCYFMENKFLHGSFSQHDSLNHFKSKFNRYLSS